MCIQPDSWIKNHALNGMINPFVDVQVAKGVISYGLSSYGYDIRVGNEFLVCTKGKGILDPHGVDESLFTKCSGRLILGPGQFALAKSVEYIRVPRSVQVQVIGKSTYARVGLLVNVTPLEPEWHGFITLEISNTAPVPIIVYPDEGIAQLIFHSGDGEPDISYADKHGKYQGQLGIVLAKV